MSARPPSSVLVLSLEPGQLRLAAATRSRGGAAAVRTLTAPLSLGLEHPEPELAGREVRDRLDAAGVRERRVVVVLPPAWVMTLPVAVPGDLAGEDLEGFLQLAAEKGFPSAPEDLQIVRSEWAVAGERWITVLAVARGPVDRLLRVMEAAGLRAAGCTLALPAAAGALGSPEEGRISLWLEPAGAVLLVGLAGAVVAWRPLEATIESEAGERVVNTAALLRELRITREQIPPAARSGLRRLALLGDRALVAAVAPALAPWAAEAGLEVDAAEAPAPAEDLLRQVAARRLGEGPALLEFRPVRPGRLAAWRARYASRRLAVGGLAAAALLVLAGLGFAWQEYRLRSLGTRWAAMAPTVAELEVVQARIREFRPWYDTTSRSLAILRRVTEAFPDTGVVTAKGLEVQGGAKVTVSGSARDHAALLRTVDQLRQTREVEAVKVEQIRGKSPAQFTFSFRWSGTSAP